MVNILGSSLEYSPTSMPNATVAGTAIMVENLMEDHTHKSKIYEGEKNQYPCKTLGCITPVKSQQSQSSQYCNNLCHNYYNSRKRMSLFIHCQSVTCNIFFCGEEMLFTFYKMAKNPVRNCERQILLQNHLLCISKLFILKHFYCSQVGTSTSYCMLQCSNLLEAPSVFGHFSYC